MRRRRRPSLRSLGLIAPAALIAALIVWPEDPVRLDGIESPAPRAAGRFAHVITRRYTDYQQVDARLRRLGLDREEAPAFWRLRRWGWRLLALARADTEAIRQLEAHSDRRLRHALKYQRGVSDDTLTDWGYLSLFHEFSRERSRNQSQWSESEIAAFDECEALLARSTFESLEALVERQRLFTQRSARRDPLGGDRFSSIPAAVERTMSEADEAAAERIDQSIREQLNELLTDFTDFDPARREKYTYWSRYAVYADRLIVQPLWLAMKNPRPGEGRREFLARLYATREAWHTWRPEGRRLGYPRSRVTLLHLPEEIARTEQALAVETGYTWVEVVSLAALLFVFPGAMVMTAARAWRRRRDADRVSDRLRVTGAAANPEPPNGAS